MVPKWKLEREAFVKAMQVSKKIQKLENDPSKDSLENQKKIQELSDTIPSQNNMNMKECPYCFRKFNQKVAERHIPQCANTKNRPKPPPTKDQVKKEQENRRQTHLRISQIGSPNANAPKKASTASKLEVKLQNSEEDSLRNHKQDKESARKPAPKSLAN